MLLAGEIIFFSILTSFSVTNGKNKLKKRGKMQKGVYQHLDASPNTGRRLLGENIHKTQIQKCEDGGGDLDSCYFYCLLYSMMMEICEIK